MLQIALSVCVCVLIGLSLGMLQGLSGSGLF